MKPSIHDILKSLAAAATPVVLICASPALAGAGPLQLIASDWDTNSVTAFDAATGVVLRDVVTTRAHGANAMAGMTVGPDGLTYLTDFATDEVRRYNTKTGALIDTFIPGGLGGLDNSTDLQFGPDGNLLAANGDTGGLLKYNGQTGAFIGQFIAPTACGSARFMAFLPGNAVLVTDFGADVVTRFDSLTGQSLGMFADQLASGNGVTRLANGDVLIASWGDEAIRRYSAEGIFLSYFATGIHCNAVVAGPDGFVYVAEKRRERVEKYNATTGQLVLTMGDAFMKDPWCLAFYTDPCTADVNDDGLVDLFDYLDFVQVFASGSAQADFNSDSIVDFFDYLDFVEAFNAGC